MGIDAYIYCTTTDGKEPDIYVAFPHGVKIVSCGQFAPKGATHNIDVPWRYYGKGYERGPWPLICSVLMSLMSCKNVSCVWYFGDYASDPIPFTTDDLLEHCIHYMANGHRPYLGK